MSLDVVEGGWGRIFCWLCWEVLLLVALVLVLVVLGDVVDVVLSVVAEEDVLVLVEDLVVVV